MVQKKVRYQIARAQRLHAHGTTERNDDMKKVASKYFISHDITGDCMMKRYGMFVSGGDFWQ
jgi:hypothetical protein